LVVNTIVVQVVLTDVAYAIMVAVFLVQAAIAKHAGFRLGTDGAVEVAAHAGPKKRPVGQKGTVVDVVEDTVRVPVLGAGIAHAIRIAVLLSDTAEARGAILGLGAGSTPGIATDASAECRAIGHHETVVVGVKDTVGIGVLGNGGCSGQEQQQKKTASATVGNVALHDRDLLGYR
jgi:hypothetical protein